MVLALGLLATGALVFPRLGSEFTPKLNEGTFVIRLTMAPSISLTESTRITQIVERRLVKVPEVTSVVTRIGRGEVGAHADPINSAEMFVLLKDPTEWRYPRDQGKVEETMREAIGEPLGAFVNFTQPIAMSVDESQDFVIRKSWPPTGIPRPRVRRAPSGGVTITKITDLSLQYSAQRGVCIINPHLLKGSVLN